MFFDFLKFNRIFVMFADSCPKVAAAPGTSFNQTCVNGSIAFYGTVARLPALECSIYRLSSINVEMDG